MAQPRICQGIDLFWVDTLALFYDQVLPWNVGRISKITIRLRNPKDAGAGGTACDSDAELELDEDLGDIMTYLAPGSLPERVGQAKVSTGLLTHAQIREFSLIGVHSIGDTDSAPQSDKFDAFSNWK